jgi:hypothetical protein
MMEYETIEAPVPQLNRELMSRPELGVHFYDGIPGQMDRFVAYAEELRERGFQVNIKASHDGKFPMIIANGDGFQIEVFGPRWPESVWSPRDVPEVNDLIAQTIEHDQDQRDAAEYGG